MSDWTDPRVVVDASREAVALSALSRNALAVHQQHGMILVGLSGHAGSGKDEAGRILACGAGFRQFAFADKLRQALYALNPIVGLHSPGGTPKYLKEVIDSQAGDLHAKWQAAKQIAEVRRMLQRLGTEVCRDFFGSDIWVKATFEEMSQVPVPLTLPVCLVVTDMRFPNEADAVRAAGGHTVRVERPGVGPARDKSGVVHASETALDDYPFMYSINNNGSLADLSERTLSLARLLQPTNWREEA